MAAVARLLVWRESERRDSFAACVRRRRRLRETSLTFSVAGGAALAVAAESVRYAGHARRLRGTSLTSYLTACRPPALSAATESVPCAGRAWAAARDIAYRLLRDSSAGCFCFGCWASSLRDTQNRNQSVGNKKKKSRRGQARRCRQTSLTHNHLQPGFETSTIGFGLPCLPMWMPGPPRGDRRVRRA